MAVDIVAIVLGTVGGCFCLICCYCRSDLETPTYAITYTEPKITNINTKASEV